MGSQEASMLADLMLERFDAYMHHFHQITLRASTRFKHREWRQMQLDSVERLDLYKQELEKTASTLSEHYPVNIFHMPFWKGIKHAYEEAIKDRPDMELCQTWYNSLYRKIFSHQVVEDELMFIHSGFRDCKIAADENVYTSYLIPQNWSAFLKDLLHDFFPGYHFMDLEGDVENIIHKMYEARIPDPGFADGLQILDSLFYRNKAVYIIGRFLTKEGTLPFVLPVIHHEEGLYVDACLLDSKYLRIIFSYTRAYFMVHTPVPSLMVAFLLSIMPGKDLSEIYNSIGYPKHGKTEQYRLLLQELELSDEQFEIAPGIPGLVMMVFTLPSYNLVFKVIRDAADPPKETSRGLVEQKYKMVKKLDRVGRLADTHEYAMFKIRKDRFSSALMKELHRSIPSQIHEENGYLVFRHLYTERKSLPLNILLEKAEHQDALEAALDYGYAIKEMAAANIFPGDMLTKNFGVTRHGRCIFYDYDEIVLLTRCKFRNKPKAETFEQIYAARPWYEIGPDDVFPEEFKWFMIGREDIREAFDRVHGDLYTAEWWYKMQKKIRNGDFLHTFPYSLSERFDVSREV